MDRDLSVARFRDGDAEARPPLLAVIARADGDFGCLCRRDVIWAVARENPLAAVTILTGAGPDLVSAALRDADAAVLESVVRDASARGRHWRAR
jgi:hypothetical protein